MHALLACDASPRIPVSVQTILFAPVTCQSIIERELQPVYEATTLEDIQDALEEAIQHLRELEVFDAIEAVIDEEPLDVPDACSIVLQLHENNWYRIHGGTYVQVSCTRKTCVVLGT